MGRFAPGPDFICAGPEKTGTGWLYRNQMLHRNIWCPPVKEVRYFWEKHYAPETQTIGRFRNSGWACDRYRSLLRHTLNYYARYPAQVFRQQDDVQWKVRFLLRSHTDSWYLSLFPNHACAGDISPQYANLPLFASVAALLPCNA